MRREQPSCNNADFDAIFPRYQVAAVRGGHAWSSKPRRDRTHKPAAAAPTSDIVGSRAWPSGPDLSGSLGPRRKRAPAQHSASDDHEVTNEGRVSHVG